MRRTAFRSRSLPGAGFARAETDAAFNPDINLRRDGAGWRLVVVTVVEEEVYANSGHAILQAFARAKRSDCKLRPKCLISDGAMHAKSPRRRRCAAAGRAARINC